VTRPKVVLRVPTLGHKAGETIEVADSKAADQMVELGQATRVSRAKSDKD
jgi:hypothetical protein